MNAMSLTAGSHCNRDFAVGLAGQPSDSTSILHEYTCCIVTETIQVKF